MQFVVHLGVKCSKFLNHNSLPAIFRSFFKNHASVLRLSIDTASSLDYPTRKYKLLIRIEPAAWFFGCCKLTNDQSYRSFDGNQAWIYLGSLELCIFLVLPLCSYFFSCFEIPSLILITQSKCQRSKSSGKLIHRVIQCFF